MCNIYKIFRLYLVIKTFIGLINVYKRYQCLLGMSSTMYTAVYCSSTGTLDEMTGLLSTAVIVKVS